VCVTRSVHLFIFIYMFRQHPHKLPQVLCTLLADNYMYTSFFAIPGAHVQANLGAPLREGITGVHSVTGLQVWSNRLPTSDCQKA
jgi:hypothetical protein